MIWHYLPLPLSEWHRKFRSKKTSIRYIKVWILHCHLCCSRQALLSPDKMLSQICVFHNFCFNSIFDHSNAVTRDPDFYSVCFINNKSSATNSSTFWFQQLWRQASTSNAGRDNVSLFQVLDRNRITFTRKHAFREYIFCIRNKLYARTF